MFFKKSSPPPATDPASPAATPPAPAPAAAVPPPVAAPASPAQAAASTAFAQPLNAEDAKKRAALAKHVAASFGEIVTLLMRSPADRQRPLQDLEWMIVPGLMTGQFAIADAQSKETGAVMTVGAVLWAFVSPDVDARLSQAGEQAPRLAPNEWRSGEIPWVVMAIGDPKVLSGLLQQLSKTVFKDKSAKIRARGADGKTVVGRIEMAQQPAS